ncbi:GTA-gp10 family protein [Emcibacter nanhaiensis]|uniref:Gene transfer agent family protein n=1 Tax=Emcibacter nanhaiensis TaxID=1505037 RepID=A0A501PBJ4_9PROT|nr:GTA-gp10 family protein [Emcibacter nanhaiensis]TPD57743.1 gene transfer agent family protein [Emcibacter nanhaiensis]
MRGREVRLTLDGRERLCVPSFRAIIEIEERLGGLVGLASRAADGDIGLREVSVILWATMDERPVFEDLGQMVLSAGLVNVMAAVRDLLAICLTGGGEPVLPGKS